ncbi:MAG: hypothetical protein L3J36_04350 [Rhodobacteraceae bacterium]|nr:hypothetical protein [Paracoccaceae bacterium]
MTQKKSILIGGILALALTIFAASAEAWRARNWHQVYPVSPTVFEVVGQAGSGAADYWCGAGDYVRHLLRMPAVQRVYIWRAIGPSVVQPGRKAVQFSLGPPEDPENKVVAPGYSLSVKAVGDNLTAAAAFQYCLDNDRLDPFFRP